MHSDPRRWLPARLIWRWGALLWLGPSLGLLAGLVLVFGFLKENETAQINFDVGWIPKDVNVEPFFADLRSELGSENTLIKVQRQLHRDASFLTPLWWLRPRIQVKSSDASVGTVKVLFIHHLESGQEDLSDAFEKVAKEVVPRMRAKYVGGWVEKIDARLGEIRLAVKAAESKREQVERDDIPFIDESEQLENDREGILMEDAIVGSELSLPGSFYVPRWWQSPPKWAILIGMCAGYGLMAVFPAVIVLEMMWPLRRAPEDVRTWDQQ